MTEKFHERFNIQVSTEDAKKRFVNRVKNLLLDAFWTQFSTEARDTAKKEILSSVGILRDRSKQSYGWPEISDEFWLNIHLTQAFYDAFTGYQADISKIIEKILSLSEVDLGIRWHEGHFLPSGSPLLDEKLVNDVLNCLKTEKYEGVLKPFRKGLEDLLLSIKSPARLQDVVKDMYEALEALSKIVTGKGEKDLSANMEQFIKAVHVSDPYKLVLKEYIAYGCKIRHAGKDGQPKQDLTRKEVESFVYLTGVFIRLAVIEEAQA